MIALLPKPDTPVDLSPNSYIEQLSSNINSDNEKTIQSIKESAWSAAISYHTGAQPSTPLVDRLVDDTLLQTGPCSDQGAAASDQQRWV